jgi:hypothetical protein
MPRAKKKKRKKIGRRLRLLFIEPIVDALYGYDNPCETLSYSIGEGDFAGDKILFQLLILVKVTNEWKNDLCL